jgi:hypothetical protein
MEEMVNNQKDSKVTNESSLTLRKIIINIFKVTLVLICSLLFIFLIFYGNMPSETVDAVKGFLWSMKPFEKAHFVHYPRPSGLHFCDIGNDYMDNLTEFQITWSKDKIIFSKSALMTKPEKTITVPGEITDVKSYYKKDYSSKFITKDAIAKRPSFGLYIFCTYKLNNSKRLALYQIPFECFRKYKDHLIWQMYSNKNKDEEDTNDTRKLLFQSDSSSKSNPYLNISKVLDLDFNKLDFTGFNIEYEGDCYFLCADIEKNHLYLYDGTGKVLNSVAITKQTTIATLSTSGFTDVYLVESNSISLFNVVDGKLKYICNTELDYSNNDFPLSILTASSDNYCQDKNDFIVTQKNTVFMMSK